MPLLFEHIFSKRSILSSSLVLHQIMRVNIAIVHRRDAPLKRIQNVPQSSWQIFLTQIILFTQIDDDLRDSGEFLHHYFALFFILLHFLEETHSSEYCRGEMYKTRASRMVSA
jgi:hypothetical protein